MSIETAVKEYEQAVEGVSSSVRERVGESNYYRSQHPFGIDFWSDEEKKRVNDALEKAREMQEAVGIPLEERLSLAGWR